VVGARKKAPVMNGGLRNKHGEDRLKLQNCKQTKKHAKKQQGKTKQKNTTEVAENKSKYKENQKQIQGTNTNKQKQKQGCNLAGNR
jgi:hypothetical protein